MQETLVDQVQDFLQPYGMFLMPAVPGDAIATKRGGRVYLTQTPEGFGRRSCGVTGGRSPTCGRWITPANSLSPCGRSFSGPEPDSHRDKPPTEFGTTRGVDGEG
jgi:hypothetical protein